MKTHHAKLKRLFRWFVLLFILLIFVVALCNIVVVVATKNRNYDTISAIPENEVGILLGTSKYLSNGTINLYFQYRIEAAVALYKAGKIKKIVLSGDNSSKGYNETNDMKSALVAEGIPEEDIYLDFAGFRTYDSLYRLKELFGQQRFTIISQKFHNLRALYIAHWLDCDAMAFNAKNVTQYWGIKTKIRENFARVKMMEDLIFHKKPKFLGDKVYLQLENGDLLFQVSVSSSFTDAVKNSTAFKEQLPYSHVGIYYYNQGESYVIEALPEGGVQCNKIRFFLDQSAKDEKGNPLVVAYRVNIDCDKTQYVCCALEKIHLKYDSLFLADNGAYYCSELVYDCYTDTLGNSIFQSKPMSFSDSVGNILPYWRDYYEKLHHPIPEGFPGTNPMDMSTDSSLIEIFRFF